MKQLFFLISIFSFLGFIVNDSETLIKEYQDTIIEHDPWDYNFDFDEVIYYQNDKLTEKKVLKIHKKKKKNHRNKLLLKFSWFNSVSLTDTIEFANLKTIGYNKIDFSKSKYEVLKEYFSSEHDYSELACMSNSIFKDILVLRKNNQTTHIIKICVVCQEAKIVDNEGHRSMFIADYEYLEKILKGKN